MRTSPALLSRHPALLTDLYQLTMAQGYFLAGRARAGAEEEAVFHLFFRKLPFGGGYALAAGLEEAVDALEALSFTEEDCRYLGSLAGNDGRPLFHADFLAFLRGRRFGGDLDAVAEGTLVFAHEPLLRVRASLFDAQLVETMLLNVLNFSTLAATKAARICEAARGKEVLEFGLRRAQGPDGAMTASRSAYIGGCSATSNVLAGQRYGIPVRGTHAHSWVMSFESEREAFFTYADTMPNNGVFLVDTYDTLEGVDHAIEAGRRLLARGHKLGGIRLDSGDLAWLSREARRKLDAAGFKEAKVIALNDLDEHLIESLLHQGAAIDVFGVGTKLVTCADQPALGGVYKLGAVRDGATAPWKPRVKLSEQAGKTSIPGILQVARFHDARGGFVADALCDETDGPVAVSAIVDPADQTRTRRIAETLVREDLLQPVMRDGARVGAAPTLAAIRARASAQLAALSPSSKRLQNPHEYPVGLESGLAERRLALIARARESAHEDARAGLAQGEPS